MTPPTPDTSTSESSTPRENKPRQEPLGLVIDNKLYDLTNFGKVHPGGEALLREFHNTDASDYFYALHSKKAVKMLERMKRTEISPEFQIAEKPYTRIANELARNGFFEPNYWIEALLIFHSVTIYMLGAFLNHDHPFLAMICVAIGAMVSGWSGHSLEHSRDSYMRIIGKYVSPLVAGFSPGWWSKKHNHHHVSCNEVDNDGDIKLVPLLWLWAPKSENDRWHRRFQHCYFLVLYAFLNVKWQYDSIKYAYVNRVPSEMILITLHHLLYLICFDLKVLVPGLILAGFVVAVVVTANHQAEEKLYSKLDLVSKKDGYEPKSPYEINDFMMHQLITTRNITTDSWILNYICGGMQSQTEHHIFPKIPLYKLPGVRPFVMDYCEENNIEYKHEGFWAMMVRNYKNVESHAYIKS